jgi:hypothetical protein
MVFIDQQYHALVGIFINEIVLLRLYCFYRFRAFLLFSSMKMVFSLMKMRLNVLSSSVRHAAVRLLGCLALRTERTVCYSTFTIRSSMQAVRLSVHQIMIHVPTLFFNRKNGIKY